MGCSDFLKFIAVFRNIYLRKSLYLRTRNSKRQRYKDKKIRKSGGVGHWNGMHGVYPCLWHLP